jgi:hypothetical protein
MRDFCRLIWWALVGLFRSRVALEAENLMLRQQINVLRRTWPKRPAFSWTDRLIFVGLWRLLPNVRASLTIVKPDTPAPMASRGVQSILALEVEVAQRAADRAVGDTPRDPRHEPCQPALGRTADPR